MKNGVLVLADGEVFPGRSFGADLPSADDIQNRISDGAPRGIGEVVFCTAMSGYVELLTDPSYAGQIVAMTYPHIGNYGCDASWSEAPDAVSMSRAEVSPAAFVVRNLYEGPIPAGRLSLSDYLSGHGVPGLTNVDTRRLTLHLRDNGAQNGVILNSEDGARQLLTAFPPMVGRGLVGEVGCREVREARSDGAPHVALLDCGAKDGILRELKRVGCRVTVMPSTTGPQDVRNLKPDALFVSNGPGDPAVLRAQIELIKSILGSMPVLGICLGHQLIAEAIGAMTVKMPFGHHGINHPVRDRETGRIIVTSQNHGFTVDEATIPDGCEIWFDNANDGTVEGLRHETLRVRTTQFHPEAAPGPRDASWIFERFVQTITGADRAGKS